MTISKAKQRVELAMMIDRIMSHPDAGMRFLAAATLSHVSVNGDDPLWDMDVALCEASVCLDHGDLQFQKIVVNRSLSGVAYRIDPGPCFPADKLPLVYRLIDIALLEDRQSRVDAFTSLMSALGQHGDIETLLEHMDEWFDAKYAREALETICRIVAEDQRVDHRFWNIVGLLNSLALQGNHHGIWIAVDWTREFLWNGNPSEMEVPFILGPSGEIVDIDTSLEFPKHALVDLSREIALTSDTLARHAALTGALTAILLDENEELPELQALLARARSSGANRAVA